MDLYFKEGLKPRQIAKMLQLDTSQIYNWSRRVKRLSKANLKFEESKGAESVKNTPSKDVLYELIWEAIKHIGLHKLSCR